MARGYVATQKLHEENSGMGYTPFKIAKDKESKQVRIVQPETEWVNLFIHSAYQIIPPTRCAARVTIENDQEVEDRAVCPLCMVDCPRSPRVYIPVRVRADEMTERVQVIMYGRDHFQQVLNQIENLPEGTSMTEFDFKIVRKGTGLDTLYFWNLVGDASTHRPLNEAEAALKVPDMEETIPVLEEFQLLTRAKKFTDSQAVTQVEAPTPNGSTKIPF